MPGLRQLAITMLAATCIISTSVFAATRKAAADHEHALLAFQRDLVSVLAPRADAMPLLGAALLARPLLHQPHYDDFHSLIARAAQAPGHGPAQDWVRLADCDARAADCPNPQALDALQAEAPDNAAVWLLKLGRDAQADQRDAARADLAQAAASKFYDDYVGTSLRALASTVSTLPPPDRTLDPRVTAGPAAVRMMLVFGLAATQPQPGLRAAAGLCESAKDDKALRHDCRALGKILEWGSSPLSRSLGLHLREVLVDQPAQQQDARSARRTLIWQVQQFSRLQARAQNDAALAQHLLVLAGHGGTEMSLLLAALRDAGVPVDPPAGWSPHAPGAGARS